MQQHNCTLSELSFNSGNDQQLSARLVTAHAAERSMSRLKLVKSRLRSTMSDEWLNDLMIMSAEKDLVDSLDVGIIINRFAESSTQMKRYLIPS